MFKVEDIVQFKEEFLEDDSKHTKHPSIFASRRSLFSGKFIVVGAYEYSAVVTNALTGSQYTVLTEDIMPYREFKTLFNELKDNV